MKIKFLLLIFLFVMFNLTCNVNDSNTNNDDSNDEDINQIETELIQPSDIEYIGAFKLPLSNGDTVNSWEWGGFALTYYPKGDANSNDNFPGSLIGTGHAWEYRVSEVSIPEPRISNSKNLSELNRASVIQSFIDILNVSDFEIPRVGLEYLEKQDNQTEDKIYFCIGQHFQESNDLTHGWFGLNLSSPDKKGLWYINTSHHEYCTNDYIFEIPENWAKEYFSGYRLATGRFRDGGWSGQGPSIFAIAPWIDGNPPQNNTTLSFLTLLKYTSTEDNDDTQYKMDDYHNSDEWGGGAWITKDNKVSVIFAGTKGEGDCWYGNEEGPCLDCDNRGWWSSRFNGVIIFYNPNDFVKVVKGESNEYEPQPYASLNIDKYLFNINSTQQKHHIGAIAYDRERGYIYIMEPYVENDQPIVHVFKIK